VRAGSLGILAAVGWLSDNVVEASAIFLGLCVLVGLVALALTGLGLWRTFRRTKKRTEEPIERLSRAAERTEELQARLPSRQEDLDAAIAELQLQVRSVQTLAGHATAAVAVLRSPLRYLGR